MRSPLFVLLTTIGLAAACSHAPAAPAGPPPPWQVSGGFVRDAQGRAVVMRGANVSGHNKYAPWFDFQGPADLARMHDDWGMNGMRFLVMWAAVEPQAGMYDDSYLDAVAQRVQWAHDANLLVVLDMHQDIYGQGFAAGGGDGAPLWTCDAAHYANFKPAAAWYENDFNPDVIACYDGFWTSDDLQSHYAEAWRRIAARLAGFDNVVGFDIMNEPYWGDYPLLHFEPDELQPLYERVVPIVRSQAPDWIAFLEPSSLRNLGGTTHLTTPTFSNFVYAPHSYDRTAEMGMGFPPADRGTIIANVAALAQEATNLGGALWIGEYGGNAMAPGIVDYMTAQYDAASAVAASTMYWDYSKGGYGMLDASGNEAQPLLDTLVRPYPERVAGDPVSWTFDAPSSTFTLTYHARTAGGPTVISVPPRVYPKGFTVDCGGCTTHDDAATVVVDTAPPGDPATLTIHP